MVEGSAVWAAMKLFAVQTSNSRKFFTNSVKLREMLTKSEPATPVASWFLLAKSRFASYSLKLIAFN